MSNLTSSGGKTHEAEEHPAILFSEFLEGTPPGSETRVSDLSELTIRAGLHLQKLNRPEIQLHCGSDSCNGPRFFRSKEETPRLYGGRANQVFIDYHCSNCRKSTKSFAIIVVPDPNEKSGHCYKLGEIPAYGPPTPAKLITLVGPDRGFFLSGRRCEFQGLGVGAFAYYRRVVENQRRRILDEIIKVSRKLNAPESDIQALESAKLETQFSKAVSSIKNAIPQALLINGHNPMTLLHSALSEGIHGQEDEVCLELASDIRIVLGELSERLSQALKDEAELNRAVTRLMQGKKRKPD